MGTFYIGRIGALVALPAPSRGREPVWSRRSAVQGTLGGGRVVQFAPGGRRTYSLGWRKISNDVLSLLERFATGAAGPGPYTLIDPERRNMLSLNQSSAGSAVGNPAGVSVVAGSGESLGVQSATAGVGPRTLVWSLPHTVTSGRLLLDPPAAWLPGFPVPAAEPWTFSMLVRGAGADPLVDVTAVLRWLDMAGRGVAETVGAPVSISDGGWSAVSVSRDVPPPGAACLVPELRVTSGTVAAAASGLGATGQGDRRWATWRAATPWPAVGASRALEPAVLDWVFGSAVDILVDGPQLDMWPTVRPWVLGTGMPQVSWLELPDKYDLIDHHDPTATLVEVG